MPILDWLDRNEAVNQVKRVPYRLLQPASDLHYGDANTENMLIQGDNLEALKALLPFYAGKVKCIYIDPPYNTQNAFEHYDDNVEHSTWLSLIYPRLELLRDLLAENGSIWVSIDDNEAHYLKVIMDEVFGRRNFIAEIIWQKIFSPKNSARHFSVDHDYLTVYAKNAEVWIPNPMPRTEKQNLIYKNPDNDQRGPWTSSDLSARNPYSEGIYPITTPSGRLIAGPPPGRYWSISQKRFFELISAKEAFDDYAEAQGWRSHRYQVLDGLETVPYVCLRLPTGGGKTLLAAHSIRVAANAYLERDFPLVLWMVPSNTIRLQTLETLKNPNHSNRQALDEAFDGRVLPMDIADFTQLRPQDVRDKAVVIVSTLATARVNNPELRHFYAHNEHLEPHFSGVSNAFSGLDLIEEGAEKGRIKFSFRNLLTLHRPLVLIDEAHNASSNLSVEVLQRINPACIVEYTATPASNSNVLFNVSAAELKAEEMIKLPIILTEHQSWESAIEASILNREKLAEAARRDREYIRPIVLIQAENKNRDVSVDVIRNYLVDRKIAPEKIAIATGEQRELDGINLFDPHCPIEFVITVQALKEGWDCSFAYVFCSVATVHSKRDVEQLLGRVLRMPYARRRSQDDLNQAYAHVSSASWPQAVSLLHDRLVSMGFESQEAEQFIKPEPLSLPLGDLPVPGGPGVPFEFTLSEQINVTDLELDLEEQTQVQVSQTQKGENRLRVTGLISNRLQAKLEKAIPKKDKQAFEKSIRIHKQHYQTKPTAAEQREPFPVPQLCLKLDGEWELAEKELFLYPDGWNLLDFSPALTEAEFAFWETERMTKIDVRDAGGRTRVVEQALDPLKTLDLNSARSDWTAGELSRWLDKYLRQPDVKQPVLLEFLRRSVDFLTHQRKMSLPALVHTRFALQKVLLNKIQTYRYEAYQKGFQEVLFGREAEIETRFDFGFRFDPQNYPARNLYTGSYQFVRHYHRFVGDLDNRGEEFECAQAIDRQALVKYWIRNLERQPEYSFWLPTSTDRFYPDFVAELQDGRVLVVEYKGGHLLDSSDTKEKQNLGELWEEKSNGKGLFLLAVAKDDAGRDVYQQLQDKIAN